MSGTVRGLCEEAGSAAQLVVPLPNVEGDVLAAVLEYCAAVADGSRDARCLCEGTTPLMAVRLFCAAEYLNIPQLHEAAAAWAALEASSAANEAELRARFEARCQIPEPCSAGKRRNLLFLRALRCSSLLA
jgi:hypothetical protein